MARTWQEAWLHAEAQLLVQSLDSNGNPAGAQNIVQRAVNVRVEPVLHQEMLEEPGCGFRQNFAFPVGFNITIGSHDLRDVAAQIQAWLADTTQRYRLLLQNLNAYYQGLPMSTNAAEFDSSAGSIGLTTTAPHKLAVGDQVMLAGWTWATGGGNVNGSATVTAVGTTTTFTLVPTACPTAGSNPTVIGTVGLWCTARPEAVAYAHNDIRDFRGISVVKAPSQSWAGLRSQQETEFALWAEEETPYVPGS